VPAFEENTVSFKCWEIRKPSFGKERDDKLVELDDAVPLLKGSVDQGDDRVDANDTLAEVVTSIPSMVTLHRKIGMEEVMKANHEMESKVPFSSNDKSTEHANLFEDVDQSGVDEKETTFGLCSSSENERENGEILAKENQDGVLTDSQSDSVREASEDKPADKPAGACKWGRAFSVRQRKKLAGLKIEAINIDVGSQLDSSLGSPCARDGSHDGSSGFDSGKPESSSSDITTNDVAPMLDEIGPPFGDELSSPVPIAFDDFGRDSSFSPLDFQIDSDNNNKADASKAENDAKDGEEKKDDGGNKPAFAWTADEDKNDMDLGYSEVERSRRLEFLMAKRRSRKNIMFDLDRNMIDIDGNDVCQSADRFSRFRMQVQPISVQRRSPFDLASDPDEAAIPGSAPSVMHRQKNLFELPSEQSNDSGVSAHHDLDSQQFATSSHRDMVFRRRDTFNFGSQERQRSTFKPCFVLEAMDMEEESTSSFQRQFSGKSVSKLSVVSESDTLSSAADQEELNDLVKKDFQRWFSDKSMSKLSIVSESDTLSLVADQEEHNDFVMKDIQRWFSDKSMSKLSIVSESDALSLVADQEEHGDLINKEFLWHFHRQFSDKSVSKRTESGTISVVADQEEHSDFNKDFLWYFQRQFSDMSVSKLSTAAESDIISSVVADADQEDHDDPMKKDFLLEHASSELLRQETDFDILEERSDLINLVDGETLSAVTSGVESEPVEDTAT